MLVIGDEELREALRTELGAGPPARRRLFLKSIAEAAFRRLRDFCAASQLFRVGYSVKTNPRSELLHEALACGFYAECISAGEVGAAHAAGFDDDRILYNGPVPAARLQGAPSIVFADSIAAYRDACRALSATRVGCRLRPKGVQSRFGIAPDDFDELVTAVRESGRSEIAVSFQVRSEDYGTYTFRTLCEEMVEAARCLASATSTRVVAFDVGGGRSAAEFDESHRRGDFAHLHACVSQRLPRVERIILEPGQELDYAVEAMVAPILERRNHGVVIDAGIPDFPEIGQTAHRLFALKHGTLIPLAPGSDRIFGRTCLEYDIAGTVALPQDVGAGDAIVVADVGAYDASMQFAFAQGAIGGNNAS